MNDIASIERLLKALKNDYDNGRLEASVYLRMKNSYELRMDQIRRGEDVR